MRSSIPKFQSLKFLNFKLSRSEYQDTRACRRFKEELLSFELKKKSIDRRKLMESYKSARASLQATLSPLDFAHPSVTDLVEPDLVSYFALPGRILTSLAPGGFLKTPW